MKIAIIDDESEAIRSLEIIVTDFCDDAEVVGTAKSVVEGVKMINNVKPDLLFLDIEMPGGNGFDLLECFEKRDFSVAFVTAYNEYAVRAFKFSAVDYLMKPVNIEEVVNVVKGVKESKSQDGDGDGKVLYNELIENLQQKKPERIVIKNKSEINFLDLNEIVRIKADNNYSLINTDSKKRIVSTKTIKFYDSLLKDFGFQRIHQSYLVNMAHIKKYVRIDNGYLIMSDNEEIPVSKSFRNTFLNALGDLG